MVNWFTDYLDYVASTEETATAILELSSGLKGS